MTDFIKKQMDDKVEIADKEMKYLSSQLPHFFRGSVVHIENRKAFQPIPSDASGKDWREAINSLQQEVKDILSEQLNAKQAFAEAFRKQYDCFEVLKTAYDIQGRALVALCTLGEVSFDQLSEIYANNPGNDVTLVKDESEGTMPF